MKGAPVLPYTKSTSWTNISAFFNVGEILQIDGLVQDCSNSLQYCTKPAKYTRLRGDHFLFSKAILSPILAPGSEWCLLAADMAVTRMTFVFSSQTFRIYTSLIKRHTSFCESQTQAHYPYISHPVDAKRFILPLSHQSKDLGIDGFFIIQKQVYIILSIIFVISYLLGSSNIREIRSFIDKTTMHFITNSPGTMRKWFMPWIGVYHSEMDVIQWTWQFFSYHARAD